MKISTSLKISSEDYLEFKLQQKYSGIKNFLHEDSLT